jgi:type 1 glutamine amidotransferase
MLPDYLADYELLFFAHPTGQLFSSRPNGADVMDAVESFMTNGGGWVGINGSIDMEITGAWPWYQDNLTGSLFTTHQSLNSSVAWTTAAVAADHPVIRGLPSPWARNDEYYNLTRSPANVGFSILGTLAAPDLRPVVWSKEIGAEGRAVCTSLGQLEAPFAEAPFRRFMLQSILWAVHRLQ